MSKREFGGKPKEVDLPDPLSDFPGRRDADVESAAAVSRAALGSKPMDLSDLEGELDTMVKEGVADPTWRDSCVPEASSRPSWGNRYFEKQKGAKCDEHAVT